MLIVTSKDICLVSQVFDNHIQELKNKTKQNQKTILFILEICDYSKSKDFDEFLSY